MKNLLILLFSAAVIAAGFTAVTNLLDSLNTDGTYIQDDNGLYTLPYNNKTAELPVYKGVRASSGSTQTVATGMNIDMESVNKSQPARVAQNVSLPAIQQNTVDMQGLSFQSEKRTASAQQSSTSSYEGTVAYGGSALLAVNSVGSYSPSSYGLSSRLASVNTRVNQLEGDDDDYDQENEGTVSPGGGSLGVPGPVPDGTILLLAFGILYILYAVFRKRKGAIA